MTVKQFDEIKKNIGDINHWMETLAGYFDEKSGQQWGMITGTEDILISHTRKLLTKLTHARENSEKKFQAFKKGKKGLK